MSIPAQAQQSLFWRWGVQAESGSSPARGRATAVDAAGYAYVLGSFRDTVTFDSQTITTEGGDDIFLVKYDAFGTVIWAQSFGTEYADYGCDIVIDPANNIYITGSFKGDSIDFGGTTALMNDGRSRFVAKFDENGVNQWASPYGGIRVALAPNGNVYTAGAYYEDSLMVGSTIVYNQGRSDIYVFALDNNGNALGVFGGGGSGYEHLRGMGFDANGNVTLAGITTTDTLTLGGTTLYNRGEKDIFVAQYTQIGAPLWATMMGGTRNDECQDIAVDANGNVFVVGGFESNQFIAGNDTAWNFLDAISRDIFVAKVDNTGSVEWLNGITGPGIVETAQSAAVDAVGNFYVLGSFDSDTLVVDPTYTFFNPLTENVPYFDVFALKYDTNGGILGAIQGSGAYTQQAWATALAPDGSLVLTGEFLKEAYFGDTELTAPNTEMFVARVTPASLSLAGVDNTSYCSPNGTVDLTIAGGTPPFTFIWSNGDSTEDLSNLPEGNYSVLFTDQLGFQDIIDIDIDGPDPLMLSAVETEVSYIGAGDGAIDLTVTGGTQIDQPADTLAGDWLSGNSRSGVMFDVDIQNHLMMTGLELNIRDETDQDTLEIYYREGSYDPALYDSTMWTKLGVFPFYSAGQDTNTSIDLIEPLFLEAGKRYAFFAVVTSQIGNNRLRTSANNASSITGTPYVSDANMIVYHGRGRGSRSPGQGVFDVGISHSSFSGALRYTLQLPYTYQWTNGDTLQDIYDVPMGNYGVMVTDALGCSETATYVVNPPALVDSLVTATILDNTSICGGNGSIELTVLSGFAPYTYLWSTGETTPLIQNLAGGTYYLTVYDADSNMTQTSFVVNDPAPITFDPDIMQPTAGGGADGSIMLNISGGAPFFQPKDSLQTSWTSTESKKGSMFDVLPLNDMEVLSFDLNLRTSSVNDTISVYYKEDSYDGYQNDSLAWTHLGDYIVLATGDDLPTYVELNDGLLLRANQRYAFFIGNVGRYNSSRMRSISGLGNAGDTLSYDSNLITYIGRAKNTGGEDGLFGANSNNNRAFSGRIHYSLQMPYNVMWNTPDTLEMAVNLLGGDYWGTVTDSAGCMESFTITLHEDCGRDIFEPNNLQSSAASLPQIGINRNATLCNTGDEDWYAFNVMASEPNVKAVLSNLPDDYKMGLYDDMGTLITTSAHIDSASEELIHNGLTAGNYYLHVYAEGAAGPNSQGYSLHVQTKATSFATLSVKTPEESVEEDNPNAFALYPNPASSHVYLELYAPQNDAVSIELHDIRGRVVLKDVQEVSAGNHQLTLDLEEVTTGTYFLQVRTSNQKWLEKLIISK